MIPKKILDAVIIISMIGIILILAKDALTKKEVTKNKFVVKPTIEPNNDLDFLKDLKDIDIKKQIGNDKIADWSTCQNEFLPLKEGLTWQYRITTESWQNNQKKINQKIFTNTLIELATYSAKIQTEIDNEKKISTLFCREKGIYGFPFPFIELGSLDQFLSLFKTIPGLSHSFNFIDLKPEKIILLIPQKKLLEKRTWNLIETPFLTLPVKVIKISQKPFFNLGLKDSLEIATSSSGELISMIASQNEPLINYQLLKDIGINKLEFNFSLEMNKAKIKVELIRFWDNSNKKVN